MMQRGFIRVGNCFLIAVLCGLALSLALVPRQARATTEGPCPSVIGRNHPECLDGEFSVPSGTDCAQCDPYYSGMGGTQKFYHCALYERYNVYCDPTDPNSYVGSYDHLDHTTMASSCSVDSSGNGHCSAPY